jgi:hypothetical protein
MSNRHNLLTRRDFLWGASSASIGAIGVFATGCDTRENVPNNQHGDTQIIETRPSSWWRENKFITHETVDTGKLDRGVIRAYVDGSWQEFKVIDLPEDFVNWSLKARMARLGRILRFGGIDPRDLAGSHNACVATYGGPSRDSAISLNTAYKGMGFAVHAGRIEETTHKINEERIRIERDDAGNPAKQMQAKVRFLAKFYRDISSFDRTKQVSLELFTSPDFHTHTFLNMMVNPIASASFLAFPTFEIRAVPQLLHPDDPSLSRHEKHLIAYTNAIHDFIHSGSSDRITCVYHVIELFDDTPNDQSKGRRVA